MIRSRAWEATYDARVSRALAKASSMTLTEAAALLGVTAATLRQQIANGKLSAKKRGRDWFVSRKEVERYRSVSRRS